MAKTKDIQDIGIVFGDWKLVPVDDRNWELCQFRTALDRHGNPVGDEFKWYRAGRFYQYNTFHLALQYAADCALKDKAHGEQMELLDALHEYAAIIDALEADMLAAIGGEG